ncbi:MAG: ATPase domain-containing protein, partial [Solirubrobacteraceae bacterium]
MARGTIQICSECGFQTAQWLGQCPGCEAWNTLVEERIPAARGAAGRGSGGGGPPGRGRGGNATGAGGPGGSGGPGRSGGAGRRLAPRLLSEVGAAPVARMSTGIGELDRVLGGGLVPGALVLLGGSPGIGKSTLTNMVLGNLAAAGRRTLYVSGEESAEQVRLRAERLVLSPADSDTPAALAKLPGGRRTGADVPGGNRTGTAANRNPALQVPILAETDLETVLGTLAGEAPEVCVIDSVQTLNAAELSGAPGSVGQVREVAGRIMELAKTRQIAVILVGHVTKDGALAGPRVLEHLVDCVLQFEGERERPYR